MSVRRPARQHGPRGLGIALLIFSLVHTPLPQPDFHNIRHHDGTGEVCEHHDHLLRWHPGAGAAEDVAILHWHWFLPTSSPSDGPATGSLPAFHAHVADGIDAVWDDGPRIAPDDPSRLPGRWLPRASASPLPWGLVASLFPDGHAPSRHLASASPAIASPCAPRASLLQRWTC